MRLLLDACILYPTVLREILLGVAGQGGFTPLYSDRILEEWARAAARTDNEPTARAEIALLRAQWPQGAISSDPGLEARLSLPDPDDVHVLAAAITGGAEAILTANLRDFPGRALARHGLIARAPDPLLVELHQTTDITVAAMAEEIRLRTQTISGRPQPLRALLKRAGLPRLGKLLAPA